MNEPASSTYSRVEVVGVIVRDPYRGPNFSYLTMRVGENQYFDWACFDDGPFEQFVGARAGAIAKISGRLGKRKLKGVTDASGRERYELTLVAEKIQFAPGREPAPAPPPRQGSKAPHQGPRAYAQSGQEAALPQKEHAAQFDADDQPWWGQ